MTILQMSFSASVLILVVVLLRALMVNKVPKRTFLILWGVVLYKLLIPFSIPSHLSAYNALESIPESVVEKQGMATAVLDTTVSVAATGTVPEETAKIMTDAGPVFPFMTVWLAGMVLMAGFFLVNHLRCRLEYGAALPMKDDFVKKWLEEHPTRRRVLLKQSDRISAPLTYGVWRPVVLLPKNMDREDNRRLQYVLAHEFIHIKRFDTLKKWLLAAALCIHWFNPLVWGMYILANRDIELSCDEAVVKSFGDSMKSAYALTLIDMEETRSRLTPLCNNFSKNAIEERITAIMKIKKTTIISVLAALVLIAGTTTIFATSAVEKKTLGMFEKALGDGADKYVKNVNRVSGEAARATAEDYSLYIDSTIFTDHNVYAIIAAEGNLPGNPDISGRVSYAGHDQTLYGLKGDIKEIESANGVRYFLYSAVISQDEDRKNADPMLLLAAGDSFLKRSSLRDWEGEIIELKIKTGEKEHVLKATIANVSTNALIFYPDADLYDGDYYSKVVLTPWEVKMSGHSEKNYASYEEWDKLHIKLTVVLAGGKKINMSYDTRGSISDEGYKMGMSRGADIDTGDFYHWWNFREWELDLGKVRSIILDGKTYRAVR